MKCQIITPKSCADAGVGGKGSPQALGSAGRYPHTCHQATGMIGEKTRPRLLHVRYKRIQMYGSISTGKLPSHQRDPMEGDCLTKPLLRGHVKVGELRTRRPRACRGDQLQVRLKGEVEVPAWPPQGDDLVGEEGPL